MAFSFDARLAKSIILSPQNSRLTGAVSNPRQVSLLSEDFPSLGTSPKRITDFKLEWFLSLARPFQRQFEIPFVQNVHTIFSILLSYQLKGLTDFSVFLPDWVIRLGPEKNGLYEYSVATRPYEDGTVCACKRRGDLQAEI